MANKNQLNNLKVQEATCPSSKRYQWFSDGDGLLLRVDGKVVNQVNAEISDNRPIYVVTGIDNDDNGREDNAVLVDTGFRDKD